MRLTSLFAITIATLTLALGCNKPIEEKKAGSGVDDVKLVPAQIAPVATAKPIRSVTAEKLVADFRAGKGKDYHGVIEVDGEVWHILESFVSLKGRSDESEFDELPDSVSCDVDAKYPWDKAVVGQRVKVTGQNVHGERFRVVMREATLADPATPMPTITSEALAAENTKDTAAVRLKFKSKGHVVAGKITAKEGDFLELAGDGKTKIVATFDGWEKKFAKGLKVGDPVRLNVRFVEDFIGPTTIRFNNPLVMSK